MRILLLAPGISIHSERFLQMLLNTGHDVTFVDRHNPKPEGAERYKFVPLPSTQLEYSTLRCTTRLSHWVKLAKLRLIWHSAKPDIVHVHWIDELAFLCAQARLHPLVLTCWGSDINNFFESRSANDPQRRRTAQSLLAAEHITADTRQVLARCETLAGRKLPAGLFYFGIDLDKFKPGYVDQAQALRARLGISRSTKVVLSIRRPIPQMGHHHIIRAFAGALADTNLDAVLVIKRYLAQDEEYETELSQLAADLRIARRVIWMDGIVHDDMPILYAASDVVVNFPEYDGLSVSLLEAAACRKPIITNDLPAYYDLLRDGAFTTVLHGDILQLASALESVLANRDASVEFQIEKNRRLVTRIADQKMCVAQMERIYEDVIGRTRKARK